MVLGVDSRTRLACLDCPVGRGAPLVRLIMTENRRCPRCKTTWPPEVLFCPHDGESLSEAKVVTGFDSESQSEPSLSNRIPEVGEELGSYRLLERLGEGGMGIVFLAEHTLLPRRVAIKVLHPEYRRHKEVVQRFISEAQVVNQIRHPNIIDITDFANPEKGVAYIVMEYLEGEPLSAFLEREAPMPPGEALAIVLPICEALVAVHRKNIVHRDLKPDNIYLARSSNGELRPKLLDFGIVKFLATEDAFLKTQTGQLVGTPEYMAPEQVNGLSVDPRIDVYAMGIILYELLTGEQPFREGTLAEVLRRQLEHIPARPSLVLSRAEGDVTLVDASVSGAGGAPISEELDTVVMTCLSKDPQQRQPSMDVVVKQLRAVRDGKPLGALAGAGGRVRWHKLTWLAMVLAVIASGLSAWVFLVQPGSANRGHDSVGSMTHVPAGATSSEDGEQSSTKPRARGRLVLLRSRPSGAEVFAVADGRFLGRTPLRIAVRVKSQRVLIRLSGFQEAIAKIEPDGARSISVDLRRERVDHGASRPDPKGARRRRSRRRRSSSTKRRRSRKQKEKRARPRATRPKSDYGTFNPFQ